MFEKEAEEYADENDICVCDEEYWSHNDIKQAFQKGAEFGYNKANEWHYVKDKLPPSGETVLLYYGTDVMGKAVMSTGCVDCKGNWYKNVDEEPIKWKEIVLSKESE